MSHMLPKGFNMASEVRQAPRSRPDGPHDPRSLSILRLPAVMARTGLSRSAIYLLISKGAFPQSVSLSTRAVGWLEADIDAWLQGRVKASRKLPQ
jgi:prophage regulatory protein